MRKLLFSLSLLLLFSCSHKSDIRIEGNMRNGNGRVLYLSLLTADGLQMLDSVVVRRNAFQFKMSKNVLSDFLATDEPGFFQLNFSPDNGLTTLVKSGQVVHVTADANDLVRTYRVHGPEDAVLMWQLDSALASFARYTDTLLNIYQCNRDDDNVRSEVERHYNLTVAAHKQYLRDFITKHPHSFSSIIAFYQRYNRHRFFDENEDAELLRMLTDSLAANYPDSQYVRYLQSRLKL